LNSLSKKRKMKNFIVAVLLLLTTSANSFSQPEHATEQENTPQKIAKKYQGNWELVSINDQIEDYNISLKMSKKESRIGGSTGCNSFGGEVLVNGNQLTVKRVFSTKKMCQPELMKKEQRILSAIKDQFSIDTDRNKLILYNERTTFVFQQMKQNK